LVGDRRKGFVRLEAAGFGFDEQTSAPGQFYDFNELRRRTPTRPTSTRSSSTEHQAA
jgi:hypothetical protein